MRVNILLSIVKEDLRRNVRHQMGRSVGDVNIVFMYEILNTIKKKIRVNLPGSVNAFSRRLFLRHAKGLGGVIILFMS